MQQNKPSKEKPRRYNLLCLRQEKRKMVYLTISFSSEPEAVLRKHWRGDVPETKEIFSRQNQNAEPKMWVWDMGFVTRRKALRYLTEWETLFRQEGYEIIRGEAFAENAADLTELSGSEKRRLRNLSVSALLGGGQGKIVECSKVAGRRLSPSQKFATNAAEEFLQFRVKSDTADRFRRLCDGLELTQNQGLELLMSAYREDYDPLLQDLQSRLEKAVAELNRKDQRIKDLQEALKKSEEGKEYPKKYQAALLQHQLLRSFLDQLPVPDTSGKHMIKRYSHRSGKYVLPERKDYTYPSQEGILKLTVEHMDYSRGANACLFIYGKDENGKKVKIRWYTQKQNRFGEWMWDSPYLWVGSLWHLAVRRDGEVMELVGSIPDILSVSFLPDEKTEPEEADPMLKWVKEDEELSLMYNSSPEQKDLMPEERSKRTRNQDGFLEQLINAAKIKKR